MPDRAFRRQQVASGKVGRRHVLVGRDRNQRAAEPPGHVLDEARLAAAGRALEHDRQAVPVGGLEQLDLAARGPIVRFGLDPVGIHGSPLRARPPRLKFRPAARAGTLPLEPATMDSRPMLTGHYHVGNVTSACPEDAERVALRSPSRPPLKKSRRPGGGRRGPPRPRFPRRTGAATGPQPRRRDGAAWWPRRSAP